MNKYESIKTLWKRDPDNKYKTLLEGQYAMPEFEFLDDVVWDFYEKIDGTNVRVIWNGTTVEFRGRTDKATLPNFLTKKFTEMFPTEHLISNEINPACFYGEGYGAKIQKGGGNYIKDGVSFIGFDIQSNGRWLEQDEVEYLYGLLNVDTAPLIRTGYLWEAVVMCKNGYPSVLSTGEPEGLILRPPMVLFNGKGERIISKLKLKDFR